MINTITSRLVFLCLSALIVSCLRQSPPLPAFYLGGDLSYVNEMEDCGGVFRKKQQPVDPYHLFASEGANIVRLRLWHTPDFTSYSTLPDVEKSIRRARKENMTVLLNFHYSDDWADPSKQVMPRAWQHIEGWHILGDSVYQYTLNTLVTLHDEGLLPEIVQIGNETNIGIIQHPDSLNKASIDWKRNAFLLNRGIAAVKDFNKKYHKQVETMLHVAQPENAEPWFSQALAYQVTGYDWIGLSYYPKWSTFDFNQLQHAIRSLKGKYEKRLMIVETGYPYTDKEFDKAGNMLGKEAAIKGYPISVEGQLSFMVDLRKKTTEAGAEGIIYWEPAWISTPCKTQWGVGSHWENATFFDAGNGNEALPVFKFFKNVL